MAAEEAACLRLSTRTLLDQDHSSTARSRNVQARIPGHRIPAPLRWDLQCQYHRKARRCTTASRLCSNNQYSPLHLDSLLLLSTNRSLEAAEKSSAVVAAVPKTD